MRAILCDTNPELKRALPAAREALNMRIDGFVGDITTMSTTAMVCPTDSFGDMSGGVAAAYIKRFPGVDEKVKTAIAGEALNELLVGRAMAIPLSDPTTKYLIVAPIMRRVQPLSDSSAIMLAARAAALEALRLNLESIAFPCIGAGAADLPYETSILGVLAGIMAAEGKPSPFDGGHVFWTALRPA